MDDIPLPPAKPSPMSAFRKKDEIRPHMLYKYEQDLELTGRKARQLRELQAFVEWEDFCADAISPLLPSLLGEPDSDFVKSLQDGIQTWDEKDDAGRLTFLRTILAHVSSLLGVAPPALTTRDQWIKSLGEDSIIPFNPGIFGLYRAKARTLILNYPGPIMGHVWHYISMMAHETAHHLIRVKAEEIFEALDEDINIPRFRDTYPHDRSLINQHPLCAVLSACEEYRCDEEYQARYHQEYMGNQEVQDRELFLEEVLAFSLEELYTLHLRETLFLIEHDYQFPCAEAYAHLVANMIPETYASFVSTAEAYHAPYQHAALEEILNEITSIESYRHHAELVYQAMQEMREHADTLTDSVHPSLHDLTNVRYSLSFLQACTGRFAAYDENERTSENGQ